MHSHTPSSLNLRNLTLIFLYPPLHLSSVRLCVVVRQEEESENEEESEKEGGEIGEEVEEEIFQQERAITFAIETHGRLSEGLASKFLPELVCQIVAITHEAAGLEKHFL